jgi:hypothetical protein
MAAPQPRALAATYAAGTRRGIQLGPLTQEQADHCAAILAACQQPADARAA